VYKTYYNKYERDSQTRKLYGKTWKRIRDRYIAKHSLCEECRKSGKLTPAEEVHHIIPLSQGGTNEDGDLMSLYHLLSLFDRKICSNMKPARITSAAGTTKAIFFTVLPPLFFCTH